MLLRAPCERNWQRCCPQPRSYSSFPVQILLEREHRHRIGIAMTPTSDPSIRNTYALALVRIGVGALFLIFAQYKVFGTAFTLHGGFQFWINKFLEGGAYPFMAPILRGFVLPHATSIPFLVAYGELAIGLALVLGILVRPASFCGLLLMLTMLFSSDYPGAGAPFWQYFGASLSHSVFALCFAAFLTGRADSVWSIAALRRKSLN